MDRLFQQNEKGNFLRLWHPMTQHTKTVVEAYYDKQSKQLKVKKGYKTSYDEKDLQLWLEFCEANEIMLEDDTAGQLLCLRLILGRDTEFVIDGDMTSLIPIGAVEIEPETFLRIITNWLFHRKQLQQNYVGKKELAEWLDVSIPTVDRLLADGMPSKKVRSRRIFNKASINQWLKS